VCKVSQVGARLQEIPLLGLMVCKIMKKEEFLQRYSPDCELLMTMAQRLYGKNCLAAFDGNLSFRCSDDLIAITPRARPKAFIKKEEIAVLRLNGECVFGDASSEKWMHLEVYRNHKEAQAVIHAHPPAAIAWTLRYPEAREVPPDFMSEMFLALGKVAVIPFQIPGTPEMGLALKEELKESQVLLLSRHGALSWGRSIEESYFGIERIEHSMQILLMAEGRRDLAPLPSKDFEELKKIRSQMPAGIY